MIKKIIQAVLTGFFLFLIGSYFYHHQDELTLLYKIKSADLIVLFLLSLLIFLAHATNVYLILRDIGLKGMGILAWMRIFFISRFVNFHITQGRVLYMTYKLKEAYSFSFTNSISAFTYLTWFYTLITLLFCAGTLFFLNFSNLLVYLILFGAFTGVFLLPYLASLFFKRVSLKNDRYRWIQERAQKLLAHHKNIVVKTPLLAWMTLFTLIQFALYCILVYVGFLSIDVHTSFANTALFTIILMMSRYYNIIPNNLGLTEIICGYFAESFTGTYSAGIIVSSLVRIIDYLLVAFCSLFCLKDVLPFLHKKRGESSSLRNILVSTRRYLLYMKYRWTHPNLDKNFLICQQKAYRYTLTSHERMLSLYNAVQHVVDQNVPGDFVECGVYQGGSSIIAAEALYLRKDTKRKIYMYDTYEGMSEPTEEDVDFKNEEAKHRYSETKAEEGSAWCYAGLEEVKKNMRTTNYPEDQFVYVVGKVEDAIPETIPASISILRLDTDWYESTLHELKHLYPLLSPKGILILDDYGHWQGARKAVDEYFKEHHITEELQVIDFTGRFIVKKG